MDTNIEAEHLTFTSTGTQCGKTIVNLILTLKLIPIIIFVSLHGFLRLDPFKVKGRPREENSRSIQ